METLIVGCGYLGSRVANLMLAQGRHVHAMTRGVETADKLRSVGIEPHICDLTKADSLRHLPSVDAVVFAAAHDRAAGTTMRDLYVGGLGNLFDHLPPPKKFVHVSSSSVYGQTDGGWVDETSPADPDEPSGQVIREAETLSRSKFPDTIILRFSGIYGPGRFLRRDKIEAGQPIVGDAEKWLNLIHVDDGAQAVVAALERGQPGRTYNVCDDEPVRRRQFYEEMAKVLAAPPPRFQPLAAGMPSPPHEKGNRRIRNERMRSELGVKLLFPNYRDGLAAAHLAEALISSGDS